MGVGRGVGCTIGSTVYLTGPTVPASVLSATAKGVEMANLTSNSFYNETLAEFERVPTVRFLNDRIERLQISADAKAVLMDISKITLTVGSKVLSFGRKILAIALELSSKFQNVLFGVLIALILSAVLATIPFLGPTVSTLMTPVMMSFGIARGAVEDFRNMSVQSEIDALKERMSILSAHSVG